MLWQQDKQDLQCLQQVVFKKLWIYAAVAHLTAIKAEFHL